MTRALKTLIRKTMNIFINLKRNPYLTLKFIFKYLFVRYLYRTVTWLILTVVFGNSIFEKDIFESITNTLSSFWNSIKNLGWNITVFLEYKLRSFLSWITNKDYSKPQKSGSIIPWFNNTSIPKKPNIGGGDDYNDYTAFKKKQEAEWY